MASLECNVVKTYSGREALPCVLAQDFAVIILDIHMPLMDGFETAALIRGRMASASTPIIFLTADDRVGTRVLDGYRVGAVDYLCKPVDTHILRSKIAELLLRLTSVDLVPLVSCVTPSPHASATR